MADAVCATLEQRGVRVWIAPRDILPGTDWSAAIVDAIEGAKVMVLVFSKNANASPQIVREVERAVSKGLTIMPLRIEDVAPGRNLEYFLGTPHWLDAITPPLERHLEYLADTVGFILERGEAPRAESMPVRQPRTLSDHFKEKPMLWAAVALPLLLVFAFATGILGGDSGNDGNDGGNGSSDGTFSSIDPALTGTWDIISAYENMGDGATVDWTATINKDAKYEAEVVFRDAGAFSAHYNDPKSGTITLKPDTAVGGHQRGGNWRANGNEIVWTTYSVIPSSMSSLITFSSPTAIGNLATEETWPRVAGSGPGFEGTYEHEIRNGNLVWKAQLEIKGARYTFTARLEDTGNFYTEAGRWRQVSSSLGLTQGDYQVVDASTVILRQSEQVAAFGPTAQVTWKRLPNQ